MFGEALKIKIMKKLLLILLCLPIIGFGQLAKEYIKKDYNMYINGADDNSKKYIIKIKPSSLFLRDISFSYETELIDKHSVTIGIPLYLKRDIANMVLIKSLAPLFLEDADKDDVDDILDDAEGIGYLSGYGIVLKYKKYINKDAEALTGFYFSPEYYFRKFNIEIDASQSDLLNIYNNDNSPINFPTNSYELEGDIKINTISLNFGHQWIRDWFSVDVHIGLAHYSLKYDFEEESGSYENDEDDTEQMWLPRIGLNLGVAF